LIAFNNVTNVEGNIKHKEINLKEVNHKTVNEVNHKKPTLDDFLDQMGFLESSNNYRKINTLGYLGKYQFGKSTLETLGYGDIPNEEFVNSPKLQEKIMIKNLKFNKKVLETYIEHYEGECVNNVIITESGLLGAAHLAGAGNVRKFICEGYNPQDSYGTKLSDYLIKFSNYELNLD
jgi:hypothetical protein